MKYFSGELGSITNRILFVGRQADSTGMSEISRMFSRMFGSYIPMKWVQVWDPRASVQVKRALDRNQIVVFAEMPWHNQALLDVVIKSKSGSLVGVFLWDSTQIPDHFLRVLSRFQKVIVPTGFIRDVLSRSLPNLEVSVIPLALDTRRFALSTLHSTIEKNSKTKRIGIIASQHPRKNLGLALSAANRLWGKGEEFELIILGFLKQGADLTSVLARIPREIKDKFLQVHQDEKNEVDFLAILSSFDLLLSVSSGEGFNIPARQALSSGIPILVTDIPGHQELKGLPGVSMIPVHGVVPAIYPEFGSRVFGTQSLIKVSEIEKSIHDFLHSKNKIPPLTIANSSQIWDFRKLEPVYREEIFRVPKTQQKKMEKPLIVVGHDAGFFSMFNTFVSIQNTWSGQHGFHEIYPDWRVSSMQRFWKTNEFKSFCYGKPTDGNIYFKLFDVEEQFKKSEQEIQDILDSGLKAHTFNASADPNLTFTHADKLYRSFGLQSWRDSMRACLGGLKPNKNVQDRLDKTFNHVDADTYLIGMHVRHPSHAIEQPDSKIAVASDYISLAEDLIREEQLQNPGRDIRVFLATDQEVVKNQFIAAFGESLISIAGVSRVSVEDSIKYEGLQAGMKLSEGFQIQHIKAGNPHDWSLGLAEDVIADAWGLAKCNVMVHTVSNVATAVMFINPKIRCIPIYKGMNLRQIESLNDLRRLTSII